MQDFEKLGVFYLGRKYDLAVARPLPDLLLYESKDLVTHAVCVGMTGSGKTGLCLALLEEAAIDGIPALVIDPKGDLSNLLLTFPDLKGDDFAPWVNADDARRKGLDVPAYAQQQAELWKKGLAEWGQDGDRIRRLRQAADFAIYTPGSSAGLPVSVLESFAAPSAEVLADPEQLRERVSATATSLLGLLGIQADPVQSREHILLSTILSSAWKESKDLALGDLIHLLQEPPVTRIGVVDLESFFPAKERYALAMQLNNLLASPGFAAWMEGEPLDIQSLLHGPDGKPRIAIFSIAHLSDAERMFLVSLLLNQVVSWMRAQAGTTSLRALVYMDEIFGYFPPVANPPSKQPLLTLLKQARAFGVGVVLATQNPVDLDYKGLANAGTWFIGRLQTERDKARVLEGLEGAAAGAGAKFDRGRMEQTLAGLGNRIFLMNNVHEDAPVIFQVRWAMSYLRGPLTREQIKTLMAPLRAERAPAVLAGSAAPAPAATTASGDLTDRRPVLPPDVTQVYLPVATAAPPQARLVYRPKVLGNARITFSDTKLEADVDEAICCLADFPSGPGVVNWGAGEVLEIEEADLEKAPEDGAHFAAPPAAAGKAKNYEAAKKSLADHLFRARQLDVLYSADLDQYSKPGEVERDFRVRLQQAAREQRDALAVKLREKYAPKVAALEERIRKAQQSVQREAEQAQQSTLQTAISFGATVLSAFMGRKRITATSIGKATTAIRGAGRAMKDSSDVTRARENVKALEEQLAGLEEKFQAELESVESKVDPLTTALTPAPIKPKKKNISVQLVVLAWAPCWQQSDQRELPAWER